MSQDQRHYERVPLSVEVTLASDHNFFAGITDNISEGGLFVATHQPPALGTLVELSLQLPNAKEPFRLRGAVCWIRDFKAACDGAPPGCGIQWSEISVVALIAIKQFIAHRDTIYFELDDAA